MRFIIPLVLVGAAIGLFVAYTNPTYQHIKVLQAQVGAYNDALNKANEIKGVRDKLISKRNTFATESIRKLERILPDNIDNIRFIIDINNIAARRNLTLSNVSLGSVSDSKGARSALAVGQSTDPVGSATVSFSLTASYDDCLAFLQDLEHSLRLVDIQTLDFKPAGTGDKYSVSMTIKTYWLH